MENLSKIKNSVVVFIECLPSYIFKTALFFLIFACIYFFGIISTRVISVFLQYFTTLIYTGLFFSSIMLISSSIGKNTDETQREYFRKTLNASIVFFLVVPLLFSGFQSVYFYLYPLEFYISICVGLLLVVLKLFLKN